MRLGREIDGGVGDAARLDQGGLQRWLGRQSPTPAEPHRAGDEQITQRHGKAARGRDARFGNRNSVRDDHDACHSPSSQLRDKRMADRISPTCEYVCGKLPHSSPVFGSISSDSSPTWLRRASKLLKSSSASWRRPTLASASMYQKVQSRKALDGLPKSSDSR